MIETLCCTNLPFKSTTRKFPMNTPQLTIAIPVYERTEYFEEALESALSQTIYCPIVVVDNGSSHNRFRDIIELKNSNILYKKNSKNLGMFANWNLAAKSALTNFVIILGDDDYLNPDYAEKFLATLHAYPDIDAYYTDIKWFSDRGQVNPENYKYPFGYIDGRLLLEYAAMYGLGVPTTSLVIRRSVFDSYSFLEEPHGSSDWLFVYQALAYSKIYGNKELLAGYRKSIHSDTAQTSVRLSTAVSATYIYWEIFKSLESMNSPYAKVAKQRAVNSAINLGVYWKKDYISYMKESPVNLYQQHLHNQIFPLSNLAKSLACTDSSLLRLYARVKRKIKETSLHKVK